MLPCNTCAYQRAIPGDCHIRCVFAWTKADGKTQAGFPVNSQGGPRTDKWFMFPFNYDPVWGPNECPAQSETADPQMILEPGPLAEWLSLLR